MAEITLVRHGQASFGADNYDQLSPLGEQQSVWLGEHWRLIGESFDSAVIGAMARHQQTFDGILSGLQASIDCRVHSGLNEYQFSGLLEAVQRLEPKLWADTGHAKRDYYFNMKRALGLWMSGAIETDGQDSWLSFCERILNVFNESAQSPHKRILLVTSGGPVAVIFAHILGLSHSDTCQTTMHVKNTSVTRFLYRGDEFTLDCFNSLSHLQTPERRSAITFS